MIIKAVSHSVLIYAFYALREMLYFTKETGMFQGNEHHMCEEKKSINILCLLIMLTSKLACSY